MKSLFWLSGLEFGCSCAKLFAYLYRTTYFYWYEVSLGQTILWKEYVLFYHYFPPPPDMPVGDRVRHNSMIHTDVYYFILLLNIAFRSCHSPYSILKTNSIESKII
jgi:hypothetical protein